MDELSDKDKSDLAALLAGIVEIIGSKPANPGVSPKPVLPWGITAPAALFGAVYAANQFGNPRCHQRFW
jgi:hypothetical protein